MNIGIDYYERFPNVLKNALASGRVCFPNTLQQEYNDLPVYRGVTYKAEKTEIDLSDFLSQMEIKERNPLRAPNADPDNISSYSCSCFLNLDQLHLITNFPRKNKAIAKGIIKKKFGPIDINESTTHVNLYLFKDIDPSSEFEVIEKWEKNG